MKALDVGLGARQNLRGRGVVVATYRKAAYLRHDAGLIALTGPDSPPGPIHLRCPVLPRIPVGMEVEAADALLIAGGWRIDLDAPTWSSVLPAAVDLRAGTGAALAVLASVRPAMLLAGDVPAVWPDRAEVLRAGDLHRAAVVLGGRGPGLTPAGDDVLAGLLLVAFSLGHGGLASAAAAARTNGIAASYLHWAARGHSIAPAHDLLDAVAGRDGGRIRSALARLRRVGASSGSDLAYGISLGLRHLACGSGQEPVETQIARAGLAPGLVQRRGCSVR
ncbi:MAG: DUF2877 domain-containing protein [Kribbellaceae bacterium]